VGGHEGWLGSRVSVVPIFVHRADILILFIHSLQVCVLSVFLLAGLLGPLLAKTAKLPIEGGADLKPPVLVVSSYRKVTSFLLCFKSENLSLWFT
jgi:hypothetical protein